MKQQSFVLLAEFVTPVGEDCGKLPSRRLPPPAAVLVAGWEPFGKAVPSRGIGRDILLEAFVADHVLSTRVRLDCHDDLGRISNGNESVQRVTNASLGSR
jgi:hypothetical protein